MKGQSHRQYLMNTNDHDFYSDSIWTLHLFSLLLMSFKGEFFFKFQDLLHEIELTDTFNITFMKKYVKTCFILFWVMDNNKQFLLSEVSTKPLVVIYISILKSLFQLFFLNMIY